MKVLLSSEIRRYLTVCRDSAWEFFFAFMGPSALYSWRACKACRCARSAFATAARLACASWNNFSCSALALASSAALFFAAIFSSWARFLASAARFLSFFVYLPASHSVASMASRDFSRTRKNSQPSH